MELDGKRFLLIASCCTPSFFSSEPWPGIHSTDYKSWVYMQKMVKLLQKLLSFAQCSWTGKLPKHSFPFSSSSTTSLLPTNMLFPLIGMPQSHSQWSPVNSIRKHLQDRRDVSLTAFLWPVDSKISEENEGGTVLCKFHLDIDFCATEMPSEPICL